MDAERSLNVVQISRDSVILLDFYILHARLLLLYKFLDLLKVVSLDVRSLF